MTPERHFEYDGDPDRHEALLEVVDFVVRSSTPTELLSELGKRLHKLFPHEIAGISLYDPTRNALSLQIWHNGKVNPPIDLPLEDTTAGWVLQNRQPLVFADVQSETRFLRVLNILKNMGIRSFCEVPVTTAQRLVGTLALGSSTADLYNDGELELLKSVADVVALAMENFTTHSALQQEKSRLDALLEIGTELRSDIQVRELFPVIAELVRRVIEQDFASLAIYDEHSRCLALYPLDSQLAAEAIGPEATVPVTEFPFSHTFLHGEKKVYSLEEISSKEHPLMNRMLQAGIKSLCSVPMITQKGTLGTLNLGSLKENAFLPQDVSFLTQVAAQIAVALDNAAAYQEIADLTDKLKKEKVYLQDEIRSSLNFKEIIGDSPSLQRVLAQVETVAPSDATVLILGETGTGKELIARAIHRMSTRSEASFIKLNCAAIPTGLLESELFGHEKGAFTGAVSQKVGRLELADKGTLFLDEVGDIPLELQPKLLRVLQDQEFERLGGTRTIRVNARLIAATNRDLSRRVAAGEFRSDLFYRLHVFPVRMPPLRERTSDIPTLVRYFVQMSARRLNRQIDTIPARTMDALVRWRWPGNVRELENFMERSVLLSEGPVLNVPLSELCAGDGSSAPNFTLLSIEREHILRVLRETGGVIAGVHGAAIRLGMKRTTLQSKIQRLGIQSVEYES